MDLRKLQVMAIDCIRHHGLEQQGWTLRWIRHKTVMGRCSYRSKTIQLSKPLSLLNNEDEMLDTILHEIAHAIAPTDRGHGRLWQACAVSVGARPQRCAASNVVKVEGKYQATCSGCGMVHHKHALRYHRGQQRCSCFGRAPWNPSQYLIFREVR